MTDNKEATIGNCALNNSYEDKGEKNEAILAAEEILDEYIEAFLVMAK